MAIHDVLSEHEVAQYQTDSETTLAAIAWSPDGASIASIGSRSSRDDADELGLTHIVSLYNVAGGSSTVVSQHTSYLTSVAWSPDSSRLVITGKQTVVLWDRASARSADTYTAQTGVIQAAAWSPDGRCIATASDDRTVHIWEAETTQTLFVLQTLARYGGGSVDCVAWSPNSQQVAAGNKDGVMHVWSL